MIFCCVSADEGNKEEDTADDDDDDADTDVVDEEDEEQEAQPLPIPRLGSKQPSTKRITSMAPFKCQLSELYHIRITIEGSNMIFHFFTFTRSRGKC